MMTFPLDQNILFVVDFGSSKTGLASQVGYTIRNSSNGQVEARSTSGVFEITGHPGCYGFTKKFQSLTYSETAAGYIVVVDTGEADSTLKFSHAIEIAFYEATEIVTGQTGGGGAKGTSTYIHNSSI